MNVGPNAKTTQVGGRGVVWQYQIPTPTSPRATDVDEQYFTEVERTGDYIELQRRPRHGEPPLRMMPDKAIAIRLYQSEAKLQYSPEGDWKPWPRVNGTMENLSF